MQAGEIEDKKRKEIENFDHPLVIQDEEWKSDGLDDELVHMISNNEKKEKTAHVITEQRAHVITEQTAHVITEQLPNNRNNKETIITKLKPPTNNNNPKKSRERKKKNKNNRKESQRNIYEKPNKNN